MAATTGGDVVRRSLLDSTADAFAQRASAEAPTGASGMAFGSTAGSSSYPPVVRRTMDVGGDDGGRGALPDAATFDVSRLPARELQRLVDVVVEAIEQRVVDELERRGRRNPGVF
jgi:hypothetical protein